MFRTGPNYTKLSTNLRLTVNRLKLLEKKKTELAQKARREIADYIANGKEDRARIRVEHIIREDYLVEAMELLEMYCDLLLARFGLIQTQKELDSGLEEAIASLIWVTPRLQCDIQELKHISEQFAAKYGKEYAQACRTNALNNVSEKVMHKLSVQAPPKILVERYMIEIAKTYNVPFEPDAIVMSQDEVHTADKLLIDLGLSQPEDENPKCNPGIGGGMAVQPPASAPPPFNYPYPQPSSNAPPAYPGNSGPVPGMETRSSHDYPPAPIGFIINQPNKPKTGDDLFPDLPAVPSNTLPDLGSTPNTDTNEDVDFDDLTRRFEELKKKK